jgi:nuclear pore complex protein Nup54
MTAIMDQWDMNSPNCGFKYYFYNRVDDEVKASLAKPAAYEDPKAWDEALKNKPGPRHIPALCVGFDQLGQRIILQQKTVNAYNSALHSINDSLTALLQKHDTQMSIRAMDAKRKHNTIKQRCLALATKVQILQNRGYQLGGVEEDLKIKLMALDKGVSDPGLGARAEEIWARMITVQERAKLLKSEIEKAGIHSDSVLDEETDQRAKKVCLPI